VDAKELALIEKLKTLKEMQLRRLYKSLFRKPYPKFFDRRDMIHRLWLKYQVDRSPDPATREKAQEQLKQPIQVDTIKEAKQYVKRPEFFTQARINRMPLEDITRYLAVLGVDILVADRRGRWSATEIGRQILTAYYHGEWERPIRRRMIKPLMIALLTKDPSMTYSKFMREFPGMLKIGENQFKVCKHRVRKEGLVPL